MQPGGVGSVAQLTAVHGRGGVGCVGYVAGVVRMPGGNGVGVGQPGGYLADGVGLSVGLGGHSRHGDGTDLDSVRRYSLISSDRQERDMVTVIVVRSGKGKVV